MLERTLVLLPVTLKDARVLFNWRKDPLTQANSRNRSELTEAQYDAHVMWLTKSLTNPDRKLFIAQDGDMLVGTVRSDFDAEDGYTELSYTVAPEARGKGYGKAMVMQFIAEQLKGAKIKAEIKKGGNEPSEGIARALGLSPVSEGASTDEGDPRSLVLWK